MPVPPNALRDKLTRAEHVQKELQDWANIVFPFTTVDVFVAALTFELARLIAHDLDANTNVDATIKQIAANMKRRVADYRTGRIKP